jgi:histidine kinase
MLGKLDDILQNASVIYRDDHTQIIWAQDANGEDFVVKSALNYEQSLWRISRLLNEHHLLQEYLPAYQSKIHRSEDGNTLLIRKGFKGKSLSEWTKGKSHSLKDKVGILLQLSKKLSAIHQAGIIHRDINPSNIIIDESHDVHIIDFDISSEPFVGNGKKTEHDEIEGNLHYISPEQTGRINRSTDQRSDLYSLGATAYELIYGVKAFKGEKASELIHQHIAASPTHPGLINPDIPVKINELIMALLEKDPEDRYQSADSLTADLEYCHEHLHSDKELNKLKLRRRFYTNGLYLPERLYGRSKELTILSNALESVEAGNFTIVTIDGTSGVGKTTLIEEFLGRQSDKNLAYYKGKYEHLNRHIPYFGWLQIFNDLITELLALPANELLEIQQEIKNDLGTQSKELTTFIPRISLVLGEIPSQLANDGIEAQNRFAFQIITILKILSRRKNLIFFLDDVHWADAASVNLLRKIAEGKGELRILLMCSYRGNEMYPDDPFLLSLQNIQNETGLSPIQLQLSNLTEKDVLEFVQDTLQGLEEAEELGKMVFDQSQGNAFVLKQFLNEIFNAGLISWNDHQKNWQVDLSGISTFMYSTDVSGLLEKRFQELEPLCFSMLKLASCIGGNFDLQTLFQVSEHSKPDILNALKKMGHAGLIKATDPGFRFLPSLLENTDYNPSFVFVHDRVKQTAYAITSKAEKEQLHSSIASYYLNEFTNEQQEELLFELLSQLNNGRPVTNSTEKAKLRTLNYRAGLKALDSVAFVQALNYFKRAKALLDENSWQGEFSESLRISEKIAEAASLSGLEEVMEQESAEIFTHCKSIQDRLFTEEIRINFFFNNNKHEKAADIALHTLHKLGVRFPSKVRKINLILEVIRTKITLNGKRLDGITSKQHMQEKEQLQIMRVSRAALPVLLSARPDVYPLLICNMVRRSLRYGNCAPSIAAYGSFSIVLAGILGDISSGEKLARYSQELVQQFNEPAYDATAKFIYNFFISHFVKPLPSAIPGLKEGHLSGMMSGNTVEGIFCYYLSVYFGYLCAEPLSSLEKGFERSIEISKQYHQQSLYRYSRFYKALIATWRKDIHSDKGFGNDDFDEQAYLQECRLNNDSIGIAPFYLEKAKWEMAHDNQIAAKNWLLQFHQIKDTMLGTPIYTSFVFFQAVNLLLISKNSSSDRTILKKAFKSYKKWAKSCPDNYGYRLELMYALQDWRHKKNDSAEKRFVEVLNKTREAGRLFELAYFCELVDKFYRSINRENDARHMKKQAMIAYSQWGALAKVRELGGETSFSDSGSFQNSTGNTSSSRIDMETLFNSAKAISGEIKLDHLIHNILQLLIENAGANKGHVIFQREEGWYIEDRLELNTSEHQTDPIPLEECSSLPLTVIRFALNSKDSLLLNTENDWIPFAKDPYLSSKSPKSALCMPIEHQGKVSTLIYLENDLAFNTFTPERLQLLNLLNGQIAVSLENARLYANLEDKVRERTQELEIEKIKSDKLLLNILPEDIAEELKATGKSSARRYDEVAVMFTDFVNFTTVAENLEPELLLSALNTYYEAFDEIVGQLQVEKIKTVGDSYLCAAGLPIPIENPSELMIRTAISFAQKVQELNSERLKQSLPIFELRLGIHTGPLVAGVVGTRKFAYDIWGDTVNTASRMEQTSAPGKINISGETQKRVSNLFNVQYRGKIAAKNKGEIDMYFVEF